MSAALARRRCLALLAAGAAAVVAGCAQPPRAAPDAPPRSDLWSGRLAVQVEGDTARSFSAGFTLAGSAEAGQLLLYSPLGNALAELRWTAQGAVLENRDGRRESASLRQLAQELAGVELPLEALFAWLHGEAMPAPGWQVDLSRLADGRLAAVRHAPAPQATLRLMLER